MKQNLSTYGKIGMAGCFLAGLMMTGCGSATMVKETPHHKTVVTPRVELGSMTVVRVYNLKAIGMQHASTEEIEAFTTIICDMVVTKDWAKTMSDVQVFGSMMTIKATPGNHLLIEDYMTRIEKVMSTS